MNELCEWPDDWPVSACEYADLAAEKIDRLRAEFAAERKRRREIDDEAFEYAEQVEELRDRAERAEAACAEKDEAIRSVTQQLVWRAWGECRGWHEGLDDTHTAVDKARHALLADAGRAYAERCWRSEKRYEVLRRHVKAGTLALQLGLDFDAFHRRVDDDDMSPADATMALIDLMVDHVIDREDLQEPSHD